MASVHPQSSTDSLQPISTLTASPAAAAAASPASASPEAGAEADSVPHCLKDLGCAEGSHGAAAAEWVITKEHVEALAIGDVTHARLQSHCHTG